MKKKIALLLVAVLLCLSFTGCTLEGMRKSHLVFDENGNVSLNGETYIFLQDERQLLNPEMDYETMYYTTDAEVPMLLQDMFGATTYVSKDGRFLQLWHSDIYCRSDVYDEIVNLVQNPGELPYFGFYPDDGIHDFKLMSKEDSQWLRSVLEQLEPETGEFGREVYEAYVTQLEACNEDLLLRQFSYTIYWDEESYCFERYNETNGIYEILVFPQEHTARLQKILQPMLKFGW